MSEASIKEAEILKFWADKKIYQKSKKQNEKGKKFYMMDGPPYANGHIHMGTALNKILKDIAMRSRRLQGFDVMDRPGYDTHGVPIEFQVEKEIGSKSKQDIVKYGVDNFIKKCKEFATKHIGDMNKEFSNLGVWMNFDNPYITLADEYVEAIWHAFKEADKKDLLYLGKYPVHVCTRCGTAVAFNEIEYAKQKDPSIYVKFPLKDKKNTFLIIFTTTPWTLPANTGVMVNPNADYQEVEVSSGEKWIIAKDLVPKLMATMERGFTVKDEFKGKKMEGWKYESPLAKNIKLNVKKGYEVILSARYVTTEDGSGLVHCAPGHGKEDFEVGREYKLDAPCPVGIDGILTEEAGKYAGKKAREVDFEIIKDLDADGFLVYKHSYEHDYPLCWRDKSPLIMISQPQWFLKISDIQKKLLKENQKNNWNPDWMKQRMNAWLEGINDWPVSRQRYWGTPLPIWYDAESGEKVVVGSIEELKKLSGVKNIDVHKPGIDNIKIKTKSGKILTRVPEVLDVWFDSGVSSWAALGYPKDDKLMKKYWPADLNIEGKDQVRGWWNSQYILSEISFDKKPFDNILVHGMITDISKKKMSKSLGNVTAPSEVIDKFSRDLMRYYFAKLSKGEDFAFNENEFKDIQRVMTVLLNINNFVGQLNKGKSKIGVEDKWIISKYNSLVEKMIDSYNNYKFPEAVQALEQFLVNDLSKDYIKMIRDRADETHALLSEILIGLIKLIAPITPFLSETLWQKLEQKEESVHLSLLPKTNKKKIDEELEKEFSIALKMIEIGLAERDKVKIGLKWPLAEATIFTKEKLDKEILEIVARQLNVKSVSVKKSDENKIELDVRMTPELEAEGYAREFSRNIQSLRKKAELQKGDMIELKVFCSSEMQTILNKNINFLAERTNSKKIIFVDGKNLDGFTEFQIKEFKFSVKFL